MKGNGCRCYLPVGNKGTVVVGGGERERELGQGKTTLNPASPGAQFPPTRTRSTEATTTPASSLDHLSSFREIIHAILSALRVSLIDLPLYKRCEVYINSI